VIIGGAALTRTLLLSCVKVYVMRNPDILTKLGFEANTQIERWFTIHDAPAQA
jgi:hypothetical protein